jgi:outer membrane protein OmpA-like peptidoglycan-associated protein
MLALGSAPAAVKSISMKSIVYATALVLLLAGCASQAPAPAPNRSAQAGSAASRAEARTPAAPKPSPLAAEQRWLSQLFDGTPVTISSGTDGSVQLMVPIVHSFDGRSATPKPALKAVLDKLGQSLKRQPTSRLQIAAPGRERAQAARQHLLTRGVATHRVSAAPADASAVVLRLSMAPAPIGRLEDAAPTLARQPGN